MNATERVCTPTELQHLELLLKHLLQVMKIEPFVIHTEGGYHVKHEGGKNVPGDPYQTIHLSPQGTHGWGWHLQPLDIPERRKTLAGHRTTIRLGFRITEEHVVSNYPQPDSSEETDLGIAKDFSEAVLMIINNYITTVLHSAMDAWYEENILVI